MDLPKYKDLTQPQRTILNLPIGKNHLIVGPPGTGKTVLAIYRASDIFNAGLNVLMLVYNRPLMYYITSAVKSLGIDAVVNTWQSWISSFYLTEIMKPVPKIDEKRFTYDWKIIKADFSKVGHKYDHVILDESQDIPIELLESLLLISGSITCFTDEDQTIMQNDTDTGDIANVLNVRNAYRLYENFRNTKEIFDFAKLYQPNVIINTNRSNTLKEKPNFIQAGATGETFIERFIDDLVKIIERNYAYKKIGIFVNSKHLYAVYNELLSRLPNNDVYLYKAQSEYNTIDFEQDGIFILSFNCMKGLEFDIVIIPWFERINSNNNVNLDRNTVYVAVTRAKHQVYCLYTDKSWAGYIDSFGPIRGHEQLLKWE